LKRVLVIAPGHDERDRRVNRTLEVLSQSSESVVAIYESRFSLVGTVEDCVGVKGIDYLYVKDTLPLLKVLPRIDKFRSLFRDFRGEFDCIYIHDAGLLGLMFAKYLKKSYPDAKIVFDYHDYVKWEVYFQVGKVFGLGALNRFISIPLLKLFQLYLSDRNYLDAIVGISDSQIDDLVIWLSPKKTIKKLSVPNTRIKLDLLKRTDFDEELTLLWVGNIGDGRDMPKILSYLDGLESDGVNFNFLVLGNVISEVVFKKFTSRKYSRYLGSYSSDIDINKATQNKKVVGLFMGWEDDQKVGINEIASPNKVYSYLNIGIPFIYNSKLTDVRQVTGLEYGVASYDEFKRTLLKISGDYEGHLDKVNVARENIKWEGAIQSDLKRLIDVVELS
jgi:hypothetical protein